MGFLQDFAFGLLALISAPSEGNLSCSNAIKYISISPSEPKEAEYVEVRFPFKVTTPSYRPRLLRTNQRISGVEDILLAESEILEVIPWLGDKAPESFHGIRRLLKGNHFLLTFQSKSDRENFLNMINHHVFLGHGEIEWNNRNYFVVIVTPEELASIQNGSSCLASRGCRSKQDPNWFADTLVESRKTTYYFNGQKPIGYSRGQAIVWLRDRPSGYRNHAAHTEIIARQNGSNVPSPKTEIEALQLSEENLPKISLSPLVLDSLSLARTRVKDMFQGNRAELGGPFLDALSDLARIQLNAVTEGMPDEKTRALFRIFHGAEAGEVLNSRPKYIKFLNIDASHPSRKSLFFSSEDIVHSQFLALLLKDFENSIPVSSFLNFKKLGRRFIRGGVLGIDYDQQSGRPKKISVIQKEYTIFDQRILRIRMNEAEAQSLEDVASNLLLR